MMTGLKRKLDQSHELGSASGADSSQISSSSSSRPRGGNRGGSSRSRGRGKGRARIGRSKSLNGSHHNEPLPVQPLSDPQTPQTKRARKAKEEIAPENGTAESNTPRPTRQSARILSKFHHMDSVPEEPNDSGIQQPDFNGPHEIHIGSDEGETHDKDTAPKSASINAKKPISDSQSTSFKSTWTDTSSRRRRSSGYKTELETSPETVSKPKSKSVDANAEKGRNIATKPETATIGTTSKQTSPVAMRKRNSTSKSDGSAETLNPGTKKLKMEKLNPSPALGSPPSERNGEKKNGDGDTDAPAPETRRTRLVPHIRIRNADSPAQSIELESSLAVQQEATPTEISGSPAPTPSEAGELSASTLPSVPGRGRGRGGFRGRARGRGWTRGRGRGGRGRGAGRGGRGGRLQPIDREVSLSPSPVIKQLRERQKELDRVFRRVASAQRTALTVIANRSEAKLITDSNAHMAVPEYDQVMNDLKARLQKRLEVIENEYNWRAKAADALLEANKERVNANFHDKSHHIREEHLLAAKGSYMAFVEQCRQAEDDDHTETDESGSELDVAPHRLAARGFNSSFVRDPKGAALYERAAYGWDDFIQRAKIESDISPQIKEITQETRPPVPVSDRISQLTEALTELCQREEGRTFEGKPLAAVALEPPTALSALADAAVGDIGQRPAQHPNYGPPLPGPQLAPFRNLPGIAQELPPQPYHHPQLQHQQRLTDQHPRGLHRTILPQPILGQMIPPTDPRSFLPPPTHHQPPPPPPPPPGSQRGLPNLPRRILPASGRYPSIPHLNELPDPFSSAPPHLPAPQGMAYHPGPYPPHPHPHPPPPPHHASHGPPPPPPQYMHVPIGHAALGPPYHPAMYGHPPPPPPPPLPGSRNQHQHHQHQHQQHQQLQPHHQSQPPPRPQNTHPYQPQQYPQHPQYQHQQHQHQHPLQQQQQQQQQQPHPLERTPPPPYHE